MPLSCHLMLTSGDRARARAAQPGDRRIERGDPFTTAFGIWGALNCRAGLVVEDAAELPTGDPRLRRPPGRPVLRGGRGVVRGARIGQTGGALQEIIDRRLGDPFFGIFLNPGHLIHLDEWVNSPVAPGRPVELRSGMAMQVDIIPATGTTTSRRNIEDGIALADETLRADVRRALSRGLGIGSRRAARSWATRSASSCTPTCCPSRTSPPTCRRSCSGPDRAMSMR